MEGERIICGERGGRGATGEGGDEALKKGSEVSQISYAVALLMIA